jgi:pimeloyl-ACP methyl ester carboxylesterase
MRLNDGVFVAARRVLLAGALLAAATAAAEEKQAGRLTARHQAGQTLLLWSEVDPPVTRDQIAAVELRRLRRELDKPRKVRYRIYRSQRPITTVEGLRPIAEVPPLSCWNADYYGIDPKPQQPAFRYVVEEGQPAVPPGTGIYAHNPSQAGEAYYAVTVVVDGKENTSVGESNVLGRPIRETVGQGVPVLQRVERPKSFQYVEAPTLYYYVRWESPPNCAVEGRPYDYLVAVPPVHGAGSAGGSTKGKAKPAAVGIHLHCWGGSLDGGYGWWYNAEKGDLLIASNQIPYDWWTGYHELYWSGPPDKETWQKGVVRPYSQTRMLSFLDWVARHPRSGSWAVDLTRTHVAGNSMGGSGSPMLAIRFPERIAWAVSWVGVHDPARSPQFKGSYEEVYGKQPWQVRFEDGQCVWDHFNDAWYLRRHPEKEVGLIVFSNGKNDGAIGWPQAVEFYRALKETKRPHVFVWGQAGHGQRATMPGSLGERVLPIDVRIDQSLPAFSHCSLDDDPGSGNPGQGDPQGQVNLYLFWETADVVDRPDRWQMTLSLIEKAPKDQCTVDVTPRRLQQLKPKPGRQLRWTNTSLSENRQIQAGQVTADRYGLVTLKGVRVGKGKNRIEVHCGG